MSKNFLLPIFRKAVRDFYESGLRAGDLNLGETENAIMAMIKVILDDNEDHPISNAIMADYMMVNNKWGVHENYHYEDILKHLDKAKSLEEKNTDIAHQRAIALYKLGDYKAAIKNLKKIEKRYPDDFNTNLMLAYSYFRLGKDSKASKYLKKSASHLEDLMPFHGDEISEMIQSSAFHIER